MFPCALYPGVLPLVAVTKIAWLQICCGRKSPYFETSNVFRNIYILKMCSCARETDVKSSELLPGWLVWDSRCFCFSSLTPSCSRVACSSELGLGLSALVKKFPCKARLLPTLSSAAPERVVGLCVSCVGWISLGHWVTRASCPQCHLLCSSAACLLPCKMNGGSKWARGFGAGFC